MRQIKVKNFFPFSYIFLFLRKLRAIFFVVYFNVYMLFFIIRLSILVRLPNSQAIIRRQGKVFLKMLKFFGAKIEIKGLGNLVKESMPIVLVANHMTFLETFLISALLDSDTTFIIKKDLMKIPFLRKILKSIGAISITRDNPREDLIKVFREGKEALGNGINIVAFPEGTRKKSFDPKNFNKIGVKLALKLNVPLQVLALKTDFFSETFIPYIGLLRPDRTIYFSMSSPFTVHGDKVNEVHQRCKDFINDKMVQWKDEEIQT